MALQEQVEEHIKRAMKEKSKDELTALRAIKSAILLAKTEKGSIHEINEDQELKLLTKMAKQRRDSSEIFKRENRMDLAEKEDFELAVIERYLPAQLNEDEIRKQVEEVVASTGASGMKDMGKVMGLATQKMAGQADGKVISMIVKQILG